MEDEPLALPVGVDVALPVAVGPVLPPVAVDEPVPEPPVAVAVAVDVPVPCVPVPVGAPAPASCELSEIKRPPQAAAGTPSAMHASARILPTPDVT